MSTGSRSGRTALNSASGIEKQHQVSDRFSIAIGAGWQRRRNNEFPLIIIGGRNAWKKRHWKKRHLSPPFRWGWMREGGAGSRGKPVNGIVISPSKGRYFSQKL